MVAETDDVRQNTCDDSPINEIRLYSYYTKSYLWRHISIYNYHFSLSRKFLIKFICSINKHIKLVVPGCILFRWKCLDTYPIPIDSLKLLHYRICMHVFSFIQPILFIFIIIIEWMSSQQKHEKILQNLRTTILKK